MTSLRIFLVVPLFLLGCAERPRAIPVPDPTPSSACGEPLDLSFGSADSRTNLAGLSVEVDGACNLLLAGTTQGAIDFGGGPLGTAAGPFAFVAKLDARGQHLWSRALPVGAAFEGKDVIAVNEKGAILLAGTLTADVDLGGGPLGGEYERATHPFLLGLDADGNHVFSRRLAGNLPAEVGYSGGFHRTVESLHFDGEGDFVIAGRFLGDLDFGGITLTSMPNVVEGIPTNYKHDVFLAKYDAKGDLLWAQRFGGDINDYGAALDVAPNGDIILAYMQYSEMYSAGEPFGLHVKRFSPGGEVVSKNVFEESVMDSFGVTVTTTEDDGLVLGGAGIFTSPIGVFEPAFVVRLDAQGKPVLGAGITAGSSAVVSSAVPDENGGIRAVGWFDETLLLHGQVMADASGGFDGFDMHVEWDDAANAASTFGDTGDELPLSMALSNEGDRVVVGAFGPLVHENESLSPYSQGTRIFLRRRR